VDVDMKNRLNFSAADAAATATKRKGLSQTEHQTIVIS
jgi:hypothetical protein